MAHTLPSLPYAPDALEPHIDAQTMQIHHGKHHQAYVTNLNAALEKAPELADRPLEQLLADLNAVPEAVRGAELHPRRPPPMAHTLPPLPYAPDALEPHVDAQTMQIHHGKHHQAYVTNLNAALEKAPELADRPLEQLLAGLDSAPETVRGPIRNNGGGHWNHSLFWQLMAPNGGGEPAGAVGEAIRASFGDAGKFREQFKAAGVGRFGSGWAWLVRDGDKLTITSTPNQDNPLMEGRRANDVLLGLDVWEHSYYLKYQNRRPDYIDAWFNVVNWGEVEKRFAQR